MLDTKREFAHVKPLGLEEPRQQPGAATNAPGPDRPLVAEQRAPAYSNQPAPPRRTAAPRSTAAEAARRADAAPCWRW